MKRLLKTALPPLAAVLIVVLLLSKNSSPVFSPLPDASFAAQATPSPVSHTAHFITYQGESTQLVPAGEALTLPQPETPEHYRFIGWRDESGTLVTETALPIEGECFFAAVYAVALGSEEHIPYFRPDPSGRALPEQSVSRREWAQVLYSLLEAPVESSEQFSDLPKNDPCYAAACALKTLQVVSGDAYRPDDALTQGELLSMLACFYPPCTETPAIDGIAADDALYPAYALALARGWLNSQTPYAAEPEHPMTRLETAKLLNRLLDRHGPQPEAEALVGSITDMEAGSEDWREMAEALIVHSYQLENGAERWTDSRPMTHYDDGLLMLGTELYYVEDGHFLCDDEREGLSFDATGRYTSGDAEIDAHVQALLSELLTEDMEPEDRLYAVFHYTVHNIRYRKGMIYKKGDISWEKEVALDVFENGYGNCYAFAAMFYELARAVGYDAQLISGLTLNVDEEYTNHAWVTIEMDGVVYTFDPEMEFQGHYVNKDYEHYFKMDPALTSQRHYFP